MDDGSLLIAVDLRKEKRLIVQGKTIAIESADASKLVYVIQQPARRLSDSYHRKVVIAAPSPTHPASRPSPHSLAYADAKDIRANRGHPAAVFAFRKSAPVPRSQAIRLGLFLLL